MSTQEPREIAFEDIRKGDRIDCEYTNAGVTVRYGGVVGRRSARAWYTDAGGLVVASGEPGTITLLHRPTVTEPTGLGAVVRARVPASGGRLWTFVQILVEQGLAPWQGPGLSRFYWSDFYPDSIEVLSEGIEVES